MKILQQLAACISVLTFMLIQVRRDFPDIKKYYEDIHSAIKIRKNIFKLSYIFLPYLLFIGAAVYLILTAFQLNVDSHSIKTIRADSTIVSMEGRTMADLYSSKEHFEVEICGVIFGPELRKIMRQYGDGNDIKVFAVVSEDSRPVSRDVKFVQANEYGALGERGHYKLRAYLGGLGVDSAKERDVFAVQIYIPDDQNMKFPAYAVYDKDNELPKPLFLSDPIYIRTHRDR